MGFGAFGILRVSVPPGKKPLTAADRKADQFCPCNKKATLAGRLLNEL